MLIGTFYSAAVFALKKKCNVSNCERNFYQTWQILTGSSYNASPFEMKTLHCVKLCRKLCNQIITNFFVLLRKIDRFTVFLLFKRLDFLNWITSSCQILIWKNCNVSDFVLKNKQHVIFWIEIFTTRHVPIDKIHNDQIRKKTLLSINPLLTAFAT